MNVSEIKSLLTDHKTEILAFETRNDRIDHIIRLLKNAYPPVSLDAALNGPITDFVAATEHIDMQFVLDTLPMLKSRESATLIANNALSRDDVEVLNFIQHLIA